MTFLGWAAGDASFGRSELASLGLTELAPFALPKLVVSFKFIEVDGTLLHGGPCGRA